MTTKKSSATATIDLRPALQQPRKAVGKSLAQISREAGLDYQRLWRYATNQLELTEEEVQVLRSVLTDGGVAVAAEPTNKREDDQAPTHEGAVSGGC